MNNNINNGSNSRAYEAIPAALVVALAVWVTYVSFAVDDPEPYLFPRLIAIALLSLSILHLIRLLMGKGTASKGLSFHVLKNILPGVLVMLVFVAFLAEWLGLYTAAALTFFVLSVLYDPSPHTQIASWVTRILATLGFIALIY